MNGGYGSTHGNVGTNNTILSAYVPFSPSAPTTSRPHVATTSPPNHLNTNMLIQQSFTNFIQLPIPYGYTLPILVHLPPCVTMIPSINPIQIPLLAQNSPINPTSTNVPQQPNANNNNNNDRDDDKPTTESKQDEHKASMPQSSHTSHKSPPKRKKNKKGRKSNINSHHPEYTYQPPQEIRVHGNISIPREFTSVIEAELKMNFDKLQCPLEHKRKTDCKCSGVYIWMDTDIAMQSSSKYQNNGVSIFALKDNTFCVCQAATDIETTRSWRMTEKLYSKQMIMELYHLHEYQLPIPVRKSPKFKSQLMQKEAIQSFLKKPENVKELIHGTKWSKIIIFSKLNNNRRRVLYITTSEFQHDLTSEVSKEIELIPVILYKKNNYGIHHIMIVKINDSNVGISMIYDNSSQTVKMTGIHLNKEMMHIQHQCISLEHLEECNHECLNNFVSHNDHIRIGNVDEDKNKIKSLKKKIQILENQINEKLKN